MIIESSIVGKPTIDYNYYINSKDYLFSFQCFIYLFPSLHNFVALIYPFSIIIITLKSEY